ncbi:zinc-dependent alcohol dehydrogenase family protein [Leifsonia sp. F6_8S_P_1B]|uniref:Zinc-dependent alcohol dehydrogenase family protein n=1 Tax=Leifsonia williamsii TaxID=3035919 RepID=A0ABT8KB28_9MICO|nr:zinc-dependent alcohol dehydrogenase family protein [Leifsonia williamsii]MDN4614643.1 zinc-dependent alcohol dehydrogenase family protein [Leifsonia williamsii]
MRALYYDAFGAPVTVTEVPDPAVPDGAALIRVAASGLCRSDWHAWAGHDDSVSLPHVPGHEFAGVVEAVGAGVEHWRAGDRVTAPFVNGCGRCEWCRSGQAQVCPQQTQPGFTHWGSHAELVVVRAADLNLVAVPDGLAFDAAASLGCRFATAFRALTARAHVREGEWVAVYGAGGVGLSAVMIAAALGARPIAVDRSPAALELARQLGAAETVLSDDSTPGAIADLTGGGADVSVDAVGSVATAGAAVRSLRRRGRHVQIGLLTGGPALPLDRVIGWELDVLGSHGMSATDYPAMLDLVASGAVSPQALLGARVGLAEAARLLPLAETAPPVGIAVLDPTRD